MSILKEINNPEVAHVLHKAGLRSDSDLRCLTRDDLNELFPGLEKFQLRKMIFGTIDKHNTQKIKKPVNELLKELEGFIPRDSVRAALTDNGVLVDYLHILKDMKKQMNDVQAFLDAHISLLEDIRTPQTEVKSDKGACSVRNDPTPQYLVKRHNEQADWRPQQEQSQHASGMGVNRTMLGGPKPDAKANVEAKGQHGPMVPANSVTVKNNQSDKHAQGIPPKNFVMVPPVCYNEVIYKPVVCGKTFNADAQLMASVCTQVQDRVQIIEWKPDFSDHQVNIVFCPVSSRAGTDAEEALTKVTDDKPVILVLMHHAHQAKTVPSVRTSVEFKNLVLFVSVFYHETLHGLLKCKENVDAVSQIQNKLQEYMISKVTTSVNTQDETAKSNETDDIADDDNAWGSTTDSGSRDVDATAYNARDSRNSGPVSRFFSWNLGSKSTYWSGY